jgi:hypothetical protein
MLHENNFPCTRLCIWVDILHLRVQSALPIIVMRRTMHNIYTPHCMGNTHVMHGQCIYNGKAPKQYIE